jgi:hypothetical protein
MLFSFPLGLLLATDINGNRQQLWGSWSILKPPMITLIINLGILSGKWVWLSSVLGDPELSVKLRSLGPLKVKNNLKPGRKMRFYLQKLMSSRHYLKVKWLRWLLSSYTTSERWVHHECDETHDSWVGFDLVDAVTEPYHIYIKFTQIVGVVNDSLPVKTTLDRNSWQLNCLASPGILRRKTSSR